MVYFTSDLHLGHRKVIRLQNRPFASLEEMNETLIKKYNSVVHKNDIVYILGDLTFRLGTNEANELIARLKGKKILVRGNHDRDDYDVSLFEEITDFKMFKYEHVTYSLIHYPMLEWKHSRHNRGINLHGHIHSDGRYNEENIANGILRYDVGVEAHDYMPVSLEVIHEKFKHLFKV
ncbi:metallophosphoesterase [uncultured Veillonella sp.]|uniref:metallophosphoesterase n=1 Tax=uncultured Veillonella sp. TaxID=159268 RepID=UPI0025CBCDBF|nr:metallophosphoesterase [uncultured Veillonella sp.]MDY3974338.1 metallophosphoesterase [Veillonella caviae]